MTSAPVDLDLARLVREARDEDSAVADLEGCVQRLGRARAAKAALAALPPEQLRAVLALRREEQWKAAVS